MTKEPGFFKPLGDSETRYVMSLKREIERLRGKVSAMEARIEMQAGDAKRLMDAVERLEQEFGNLMARINGDGGHKAAEFKTSREAGEHCEQVFIDLIVKVERLEEINTRLLAGNSSIVEVLEKEIERLKIALVVRQVKVERLEAAAKQYQPLVTACSRWLKEYDHPMPSYFVEAFATAKEQVDG